MSHSRGLRATLSSWGSWGISSLSYGVSAVVDAITPSTPGEFLLFAGACLGYGAIFSGMGLMCSTSVATSAASCAITIPTSSLAASNLAVGAGVGIGTVNLARKLAPGKQTDSKHSPSASLKYKKDGYVNLIKLNGRISADSTFSSDKVAPLLKKAFEDAKAEGVIIKINSGGGSPVQSSLIHNEILRLKKIYRKKVVVIGEDALASGAYYVAVSADKIYVNQNTLTGSVGVVSEGYGVAELAKKLGVEHRVHTAGSNKRRHDRFKPESHEDIKKLNQELTDVHEDFISAVKTGRGARLKADAKEVFSGDAWNGAKAKEMGLVDHLGGVYEVMEKEFQVSRFVDCSPTYEAGLISSLLKKGIFGSDSNDINVKVSLDLENTELKLTI